MTVYTYYQAYINEYIWAICAKFLELCTDCLKYYNFYHAYFTIMHNVMSQYFIMKLYRM